MIKTFALPVTAAALIAVVTILAVKRTPAVTTNIVKAKETTVQPDSKNAPHPDWYSTAIEAITKAEYEFKKDTTTNRYFTPNRKNNLRFFYDENGFTAEPRTTKIAIENNDSAKTADEIKYRQIPNWKATFNLDKKQTGKGKWLIAANKAEYITDKVTIQYINNEEGMRQNFIVACPISNDKALKINFSIKTELKIELQDDQLQFFHKKAGHVLSYSQLKVWDANDKPLDANFEKAGNDYCIHVNTKDAVYPITVDPISTTPSRIVESNQLNAQMGIAVSSAGDVNGDGFSDVIVGAYLFDNGQNDEGRVYIYSGTASGITTATVKFIESDQSGARFGRSVSTAGDVNGDGYSDVIVGAPLYDNGQTNEGAIYVFHGSATGIITTPAVILESGLANANFGIAVACAGDVNGDGYSDIAGGADRLSAGQTNEGAAIIYRGSAAGITSATATILQSNQAGAQMGNAVASAGDINGDGFSDIIVGASLYANGQTGEGAAIIYKGSASGINITAMDTLQSNQLNANLGQSVSSAGDVNGDGYSDVVIGANLYDNGQTDEGAAFIYHGSDTGLNATASIRLESNAAGSNFGIAVACAGDNNGDGYGDIIIGASLYDNGQTDEGAAFVYRGSATGVVNTAIATLESNQAAANFGIAVASAGDVNGDGYSDIIVGANLYDNGDTDEGAAFVYHGSANSIRFLTYPQVISSPINYLHCSQTGSRMGYSVSSAGDVNSDGYSDVIIGAPLFDNGFGDEGGAFIFHGSPNGIITVAADTIEGNQQAASLGNSVAAAGDVNGDGYSDVIAGAYIYDRGQVNEGIAIIQYGSATGINPQHGDTLESNQANANFGSAVSSAGDVNADGYSDILVGANLYDNGETNEGRVYLYLGSASGIDTASVKILEINQANAAFGSTVSSAGDVNGDGYSDIIVGAKLYDNIPGVDQGQAWVYYGSDTGITSIANVILQGNSGGDNFGSSVASAGDINGDGFSDVLVGASGVDLAQSNAGAVYIYHGSATGINTSATIRIDGPATQFADAFFGSAVAGAGDVNGDGYSDIIVGASQFTVGFTWEGRSFIYLGRPAGISTTVAAVLITEGQQTYNGFSVAGAGDINGDGFSDVISGAYRSSHSISFQDEGLAYIYYGNSRELGVRNNLRLYNSDQTTPIQQSNNSDQLFAAGIFAKSPLGRQKGKMVLETVRNGVAFPGNPISNSTTATATDATFTNLGLTGVELKRQAIKMIPTKATNIRARVKYDLSTAITGQVYGPWRYSQTYLTGNTNKILSAVTYNWTGNVSIVWENPANWSSNVVPVSTSAVIIPAGRPRYPTINATTSIKSLSLAPGTSTNTATGVTLNITGN